MLSNGCEHKHNELQVYLDFKVRDGKLTLLTGAGVTKALTKKKSNSTHAPYAECHSVFDNFLLQNAIFTTYTCKRTYSSILQQISGGFANVLEIEQVVSH
jgi:hypothetical protein